MKRSVAVSLMLMCAALLTAAKKRDSCSVTIELVQEDNSAPLPGIIRVSTMDGKRLELPELLKRGQGIDGELPIHTWSALPKPTQIELPCQRVVIEATSGIECELAKVAVDLSQGGDRTIRVPLVRFFNREAKKLAAGNTHLHVMKLSRKECDRYLNEIPATDNLDVLFLSYLERAGADQTYISNKYTAADLAELTRTSGVEFGNGEEHRHNLGGFGQGYGHVMLLNIKKLIHPVSIGPGIMKQGTDGLPLTRGIQEARKDGATTIWCHNVFGLESEANWILGRLDAMNIYDGGQRAGYDKRFYPLLNAGFKIPFSTGTDWFQYDFSRVYVPMPDTLTPANWLRQLSSGRSFISNGPLFEFKINQATIGETLKVKMGDRATVHGRVTCRSDFQMAELVKDGKVIHTVKSVSEQGHFAAEITLDVTFDHPGWLALRIPAPVQANKNQKVPVNILGRKLYGHTSPIYVEVDGKSHFDKKTAAKMLKQLRAAQEFISKHGKFQDAQAKARVLDVYDDAHDKLNDRVQ